jgi:hypothetical protein
VGALCALLGGCLGVAHYLIDYSLFGALGVLTDDPSIGNGPVTRFFTLSLLLCALSLSSLGPIGLYGAVVARSGRPGLLAGAGALFTAASSALWLPTSGYAAVHALASGSDLFAPFEWVWNVGTFVIEPAVLFWFLGLLLLGIAAVREDRLPRGLRVLPLALFALVLPSYALGHRLEMGGNPVAAAVVSGFVQSLPFVGVALLGWVLLRNLGAQEAPYGSVEGVEDAGGD